LEQLVATLKRERVIKKGTFLNEYNS
jgi:hypothetical protein